MIGSTRLQDRAVDAAAVVANAQAQFRRVVVSQPQAVIKLIEQAAKGA
jgi:hypothetical protein